MFNAFDPFQEILAFPFYYLITGGAGCAAMAPRLRRLGPRRLNGYSTQVIAGAKLGSCKASCLYSARKSEVFATVGGPAETANMIHHSQAVAKCAV